MRVLVFALILLILIFGFPTRASELCVTNGQSICCHFMCDVWSPYSPSGYSTTGPPTCGWNGQFTLSSSNTDPYQFQGPLAVPELFLWVNSESGYGFRDGWGELSGDFEVAVFTPLHPGVSWEPAAKRFDVNVCTYEPVLLASLWVWDPAVSAGEGVESGSWGRVKVLYRQ